MYRYSVSVDTSLTHPHLIRRWSFAEIVNLESKPYECDILCAKDMLLSLKDKTAELNKIQNSKDRYVVNVYENPNFSADARMHGLNDPTGEAWLDEETIRAFIYDNESNAFVIRAYLISFEPTNTIPQNATTH